MQKQYKITVGQEKVFVEILPCSWMYKGHGLSLSAKLLSTGGTVTVDSKTKWEDVTEQVIFELCGLLYLAEPCECGNPRLRVKGQENATNRGDLCECCFINKIHAEMVEEIMEQNKKISAQDAHKKFEGYTHKIVAWIHKAGDDRQVDVYFKGKPTRKMIDKAIVDSLVLSDYKTFKL